MITEAAPMSWLRGCLTISVGFRPLWISRAFELISFARELLGQFAELFLGTAIETISRSGQAADCQAPKITRAYNLDHRGLLNKPH
jgi:hypothetical protein